MGTSPIRRSSEEEINNPEALAVIAQVLGPRESERKICSAFMEHLFPLFALANSQKVEAEAKMPKRVSKAVVNGLNHFVAAIARVLSAAVAPPTASTPTSRAAVPTRAPRRSLEPSLATVAEAAAAPPKTKTIAIVQQQAIPWASIFYDQMLVTWKALPLAQHRLLIRFADEYLARVAPRTEPSSAAAALASSGVTGTSPSATSSLTNSSSSALTGSQLSTGGAPLGLSAVAAALGASSSSLLAVPGSSSSSSSGSGTIGGEFDLNYHVHQIKQLRNFLEPEGRIRVDLCNSLVGREVAPQAMLSFQLSSVADETPRLPSKKSLLNTIESLSRISDAVLVQNSIIALAAEIRLCSQRTARGELVIVRLSLPDGPLVFARIVLPPDEEGNVVITLDPRERYKGSRTVKLTQLFLLDGATTATILKGGPELGNFTVDHFNLLTKSINTRQVSELTQLLASKGFEPTLIATFLAGKTTALPLRCYPSLLRCLELIKNPDTVPTSALAAIDTNVYAITEAELGKLQSGHIFLPTLRQSLEQFLRVRSASSCTKFMEQFLGNLENAAGQTSSLLQSILSGEAKRQLVDWWLQYINQETELLLSNTPGWRRPLSEEILGDKMPEDFNSVRNSLRTVTELLEFHRLANPLRQAMAPWLQHIYERINAFLDDLEHSFALSLGVPFGSFSMDVLRQSVSLYQQFVKSVASENEFTADNLSLERIFQIPKLHASFKGFLADTDMIALYQCYHKCHYYQEQAQKQNRGVLPDISSEIITEYVKPQAIMPIGFPADGVQSILERVHSVTWETAPLPYLESIIEPILEFCHHQLSAVRAQFLKSPFYIHFRRYTNANQFQHVQERVDFHVFETKLAHFYRMNETQFECFVSNIGDLSYLQEIKATDQRFLLSLINETHLDVVSVVHTDIVPISGIILNRFFRYQMDLRTICETWNII